MLLADTTNATLEYLSRAPLRSAIIIVVGAILVVVIRWVLTRVVRRLTRVPVPTVEKTGKGKKINIFKMKPKKGYRKRQGHRQPYTKVTIASIKA